MWSRKKGFFEFFAKQTDTFTLLNQFLKFPQNRFCLLAIIFLFKRTLCSQTRGSFVEHPVAWLPWIRYSADNCFTVTLLAAGMVGDTSTQRRAVCGKINQKFCCGGTVQSKPTDMIWQNAVVSKFVTQSTTYVATELFIGRMKESVVGPKFMMSSIIAVVIVALRKSSWICWVAYHFAIGLFSQSHDPTVKNEKKKKIG